MRKQDVCSYAAPVSKCLPVMNNMIPIRPHVTSGSLFSLPRKKSILRFLPLMHMYFKVAQTVLHLFKGKGKVEGWQAFKRKRQQ